jgi:hypothetical protein
MSSQEFPKIPQYPDNFNFSGFMGEFDRFVATIDFLGETGWTIRELDENDEVHWPDKKGYRNSFLHAVQDRFRSDELWRQRNHMREEAEEEVAFFLARWLKRPMLIPKPDHRQFGVKYRYAFRGTTKGFSGHAEVSFCSLSPVVSTSFAMKSPGEGKILIIVTAEDLGKHKAPINEGNVMAGYEREIIVAIKPSEFDKLACHIITMDDAASILREMGVPLPKTSGTLDTRVHDEILLDHGRMGLKEVELFVQKAMKKPSAS